MNASNVNSEPTDPETAMQSVNAQAESDKSPTVDEVPAAAPDSNTPMKPLDPRPRIQLPGDGRYLSDFATEVGQVMASSEMYLYAGGPAIYDPKQDAVVEIKPSQFCSWLEKHVRPFKSTKDGDVDQSLSSGEAAKVLMSEQFRDHLPEVERFNGIRLPVQREDGTIQLLPVGHDAASNIFTSPAAIGYRTDMSAAEAKAFLRDLLKAFPFADDGYSMALAIAAMMTLYCLDILKPKTLLPVFLYRGNVPGLGKGLLAQCAILPVMGYAPTGVKPGETEMQKVLHSCAKLGFRVVFFDNVTGRLASPSLESFITASNIMRRVVGSSTVLNCKKNTLVLITGNGIQLNPDMARRTQVVELYLDGNPADRTIDNPLDEARLLELRPQILAALYALVRDWAEAGKPEPSAINSNFVVWSKVVGGIVEHAGFGCVTKPNGPLPVNDPSSVSMAALVEHLYAAHKTAAVTFGKLVSLMREHKLFGHILKSGDTLDRQEKTALGRFLASQHDQLFAGGLRFIIMGQGHARRYAVQRLQLEVPTVVQAA